MKKKKKKVKKNKTPKAKKKKKKFKLQARLIRQSGNYINLSTVNPKAIPTKVAMAMPKMPARIPGTTKELHPLAVAIPQAVVGPPTFALDAKSSNLRSKRKSFPRPRITAR